MLKFQHALSDAEEEDRIASDSTAEPEHQNSDPSVPIQTDVLVSEKSLTHIYTIPKIPGHMNYVSGSNYELVLNIT